jgi:hypothetical protein
MGTAVLLLFLCRLWLTSNFPTIESTCKAIKSVHRENGLETPFSGPEEWMVLRLLRAFKKMSPKPAKKKRRPITTMILVMIAEANLVDLAIHDERCKWAALVVAVYGLLRAGEFMFKKGKLLKVEDFEWQHEGAKARLTLHNTKTMVWNDEQHVFLFRNKSQACPTTAMHDLLDQWPANLSRYNEDPLFRLSSGEALQRKDFVPWLQDLLGLLGLPGKDFNGISTRKGGANSLRLAEAPTDVIRLMGRWADSSFVFETYQAISSLELANFAERMSELSVEDLTKQGKGSLIWGAFDSSGIFDEQPVQEFIEVNSSSGQSTPRVKGKRRRAVVSFRPSLGHMV